MNDSQSDLANIFGNLLAQLGPVTDIFADHPVVLTLVIMLTALIVAYIAAVVVEKVVGRLVKGTRVYWDDQVVAAFHKPLFWSLLLIGGGIAIKPLAIHETSEGVFHSVIVSLMIILWTAFILRFIRILLSAMSVRARAHSLVRPQTLPLFQNLAMIIVLVIAVYLIFRSWNIDMTAWLASAGIVGIAVGFAAKDTLANLFSGVFILTDAPYKIGDYVVLDSGERGKVTHIGIRSTRLLTRGDVEITIPNSIMGNTRILNESGGPYEKYRIKVSVGVAYGSDIDQVKTVLMEIAVDEPQVCDDPEPRVRFRTFGASSLDVDLLCWTETPEVRGRVLDILNTAIYKRFNEEGIEIPYSKQDVYIKEMPSS